MRDFDQWAADLTVVADQGWTREELEARQRQRDYHRQYERDHREERTAYHRAWRERNREHVREYNREWMRRNRPQVLRSHRESARNLRHHLVGSLHDLACTGPTNATGCRCRKIKCYDKPA